VLIVGNEMSSITSTAKEIGFSESDTGPEVG